MLLLVDHGRMKPAYGYIFTKNNINVSFTGDTTLCRNVEIIASKCEYLFCDCMFEIGTTKHQGINHIEYLSSKYPNCKFVVSHLEDYTREKLLVLKIISKKNNFLLIKPRWMGVFLTCSIKKLAL